uniref:Ig-like domain-containing protein n=1 Tax=Glossina brevipalpis TaxID=37001 RepID=A0A1A9WVI3_9MUSC
MLNYKVEQERTAKLRYVKKTDGLDIEQESKNSSNEGAPEFKNIKKLEDNIHKPSGSSVQLMCPATGNPIPTITWTRNNERTIGRVSYKKWSIQMDDATTEDSGVYKCTICNKLGCIEHSTKVTIRDRLRSPPIISDKFPQNQTVLAHNSTYLECRVVSDLEPSIKWFRYVNQNVPIKQLEQVALKLVNKSPPNNSSLLENVITLTAEPDRPNILNFTNVTHREEL